MGMYYIYRNTSKSQGNMQYKKEQKKQPKKNKTPEPISPDQNPECLKSDFL